MVNKLKRLKNQYRGEERFLNLYYSIAGVPHVGGREYKKYPKDLKLPYTNPFLPYDKVYSQCKDYLKQ